VYFGTYVIKDGTKIVITEYTHNPNTDTFGGPREYEFDFGATKHPDLSGKSNGFTHVRIHLVPKP
jgi:hypothetical protein